MKRAIKRLSKIEVAARDNWDAAMRELRKVVEKELTAMDALTPGQLQRALDAFHSRIQMYWEKSA